MIKTTLAPGAPWPGFTTEIPQQTNLSIPNLILRYLRSNPGASIKEMQTNLPRGYSDGAIRGAVLRLKKSGRVVCKLPQGAKRWVYYPNESLN